MTKTATKPREWSITIEQRTTWRVVKARSSGQATVNQVPAHVLSWICADKDGVIDASGVEAIREALVKDGKGTDFTVCQVKPDTIRVKAGIEDPPHKRKPKAVPKNVKAIRSLRGLCDYFGADDAMGLNRRIYKDTSCGASISVQTPDGVWHHNGQDWSGVAEIVAFTIQTIVEGFDAEVNSDAFMLPVRESEVKTWMAEMESLADDLWKEANEDEEDRDASGDCYYEDAKLCRGTVWTCATCQEDYCSFHFHETDLGKNVECVACEQTRKEKRKGDEEIVSRLPRDRVVALLEGASIQCRDEETLEELREALLENLRDGTIEAEGLEGEGS